MIWQLVTLGLALALNNTLASVALGAGFMPRWHQLRTALIFALFEAVMPILGILTGEAASQWIGSKARLAGTLVLVLVGLYSLLKRNNVEEFPGDKDAQPTLSLAGTQPYRAPSTATHRWHTVMLAVALSLDNLTVGFGLGMLRVPLVLAALVFGVVSLVMTLIGLEIGRLIGGKFNLSADKLSGVVLLLTAGVMILH